MSRILTVPYRSQRNNFLNPDGACNVTSLAMCLLFYGVEPRYPELYPQFEDELYNHAVANGYSRHDGYGLTYISQDYGIRHTFTEKGTIEQFKTAIDNASPCIFHGYFTAFGHIVVATGYDEKGVIVNDPYGEWYGDGYDRNDPDGNNTKGKQVHYSWALIESTCMGDGFLWLHVFG